MSTGGYRDVSSTMLEFRGSQGYSLGAKRSLFFWLESVCCIFDKPSYMVLGLVRFLFLVRP